MVKTTRELRESFLKYFESKGHFRERSSSLVPQNDPTLLFTNAGMVQFKDCFTGQEKRSYTRATTCQKCVRAGGKHNDLESVGFTKRHHTFFEMLGNFSFGDYFKEDAIKFAWEFVTQVLKFPTDKLWVSVYEKDEEAIELWLKNSSLPRERIVKMGEKDNFWAMGDTGPCGPCSEIYYDRGEAFGKNETIFDGGERYLEFWNLVFMQFERHPGGKMTPLPKPSVDTGMGLERIACLLQNVDNNYLTDGLFSILQGFSKNIGKPFGKNSEDDVALKVLTDHIRAVSFLIADGVQPSNEGRGYVLRRILRRAIRYGKKLGCSKPFFYEGVDFVEKEMGHVYPELVQNKAAVKKMIQHEEEKFFETLETGLKLLESKTSSLPKGGKLAGAVAFQLYDTFGFPVDLTEVILQEKGFGLDHEGFQAELEAQRTRSRANWKGSGDQAVSGVYKELAAGGLASTFTGYGGLVENTKILAILKDGQKVSEIKAGDTAEIVIEKCPFYAEGGGQVGDKGVLHSNGTDFEVETTVKIVPQFYVLRGELKNGALKTGAIVEALVDRSLRMQTRINHTITHVLHATLQEVLGDHIKQAGSLVHPDYLRFDFSHFKALTSDEIKKIETIINKRVRENSIVDIQEQELQAAIAGGAKAFFDEKYGDKVRVISVGGFSKELCGGTHAERLGEAGLFKIISESSVASGVRRIVAVTGQKAYEQILDEERILENASDLLKTSPKELVGRIEKLLKEKSELQKKVQQGLSASQKDADSLVRDIEGVKTVIEVVKVEDIKELRPLSDRYKQKIKSGLVLLGAAVEGKATVVVSVTDDIAGDFQTKKLVDVISKGLDGKGGGKDTFAQVGGSGVDNLTDARLFEWASAHIKNLRLTA